MQKLLYAWELGAGRGHIGPFLPLANALKKRGVDTTWAVKDTRSGAEVLPLSECWLQAPIAPEMAQASPPLNYSDILLRFGYDDPLTLLGLVKAWQALLIRSKPRLLVADHAPSALLAARTLGIPVMLFGAGFFYPPAMEPLPALRSWQATERDVLAHIDARILKNINQVLGLLATPPMEKMADLFCVAENAILTFPELDHYPQRGPARYWGAIHSTPSQHCPAWPLAGHKENCRIFAYLRKEHPQFAALFSLLRDCGHSVILYCPGLDLPHPPGNMHISTQAPDLQTLAHTADLAVLYGSAATTTAFLMAGVPILCAPVHVEQYAVSCRVAELGCGLTVMPDAPLNAIQTAFKSMLHNASYAAAAKAFAAKYQSFTQARVISNIVERISELIGHSKSLPALKVAEP